MKTSLLQEIIQIYSRDERAYERARAWRFEAAFAHIPIDFFGTLVGSIALSLLLAERVSSSLLLGWLIAVSVLASARLAVGAVWSASGAPVRPFLRRVFSGSLIAHGLLSAVPFLVFAPADAVVERCAILAWFAGTSAWVVAAYAFVIEAALGFTVMQLLPVTLLLLLSGDRYWQLIGVACCAFLPAMGMVVLRNHALLMRGQINQFEKEELVEELAREKRAIDAQNAALAAELEQRTLAAAALREAKNRAEELAAELEKLSSLDGLTGIANRRRFDQMFEREWNRAARAGQPLALILCDIDYFKQYNDHYGHQAGDACLRQLATLLEGTVRRGGDLAARYGGEEFAVLLPDTGLANAALLADALREQLRKLGLPHAGSRVAPILTASFGVAATQPARGSTPAALLKAADEALYAAKAAGRDRVALAAATKANDSGLESRLH